jgi:hypothetical protein
MMWCGSKTAMEGLRNTVVRWPVVPLAALVVGLAACTAHQEPQSLPPQAVTQQAPDPPPPSELPVATPTPPEDKKTIVIDAGGEQATGQVSIVEAARAERARRQTAAPPIAVINDKNLAAHATGSLSTGSAPAGPSAASAALAANDEQELLWRGRARAARLRWRDAETEIKAREAESAELRQRFYAEDDPFRRDEQIKPAWDFALERLADAKRESGNAQVDLDRLMDEGRLAGALPGWLREGMELEPSPPPAVATELEPGEPQIVGEGDPP